MPGSKDRYKGWEHTVSGYTYTMCIPGFPHSYVKEFPQLHGTGTSTGTMQGYQGSWFKTTSSSARLTCKSKGSTAAAAQDRVRHTNSLQGASIFAHGNCLLDALCLLVFGFAVCPAATRAHACSQCLSFGCSRQCTLCAFSICTSSWPPNACAL